MDGWRARTSTQCCCACFPDWHRRRSASSAASPRRRRRSWRRRRPCLPTFEGSNRAEILLACNGIVHACAWLPSPLPDCVRLMAWAGDGRGAGLQRSHARGNQCWQARAGKHRQWSALSRALRTLQQPLALEAARWAHPAASLPCQASRAKCRQWLKRPQRPRLCDACAREAGQLAWAWCTLPFSYVPRSVAAAHGPGQASAGQLQLRAATPYDAGAAMHAYQPCPIIHNVSRAVLLPFVWPFQFSSAKARKRHGRA